MRSPRSADAEGGAVMAALYRFLNEVLVCLLIVAVGAASLVWMVFIAAVMVAIFTTPLWIIGAFIWLAVR